MNKKANTVVFMIGATIFNVIITVVCFVILLIIYGKFIAPILPQEGAVIGLPFIFIIAIVLSFVIYRFALNFFMKHFDVEKNFAPLFKSRRPKKKINEE